MLIHILQMIAVCLVPLAMGWLPCCKLCANCTSTPMYLKVAVGEGAPIGTAVIGTDFIVGGTLADDGCDQCESVPATYVIEYDGDDSCTWTLPLCHCLSAADIQVTMSFASPNYILNAELSIGGDVAQFSKNLGTSKPNCSSFDAEELTFDSVSPDGNSCGDWSVLKVWISAASAPESANTQCGYCWWDSGPDDFEVTFRGSPTNSSCTDCSELTNTTITCTKSNNAATCCNWVGTFMGSNCTYTVTVIALDTSMRVQIIQGGSLSPAFWDDTGLNDPYDCSESRTLTYTSGGDACTYTGTTIDLVAA